MNMTATKFPAGLMALLSLVPVLPQAVLGDSDTLVAADAPPSLIVHLRSGRTFEGRIDPRTDARHLVLRTDWGAVHVARPIQWEAIEEAEVGGVGVAGHELAAVAAVLRETHAAWFAPTSSAAEGGPVRLTLVAGAGEDRSPAGSMPEGPGAVDAPRVRAVAVTARAESFGGGVDADGLRISVRPRDGAGRAVPVSGTLRAELFAERVRPGPRQPAAPVSLGRWTLSLAEEDFEHGVARVELPYRAVHPEFDMRFAPTGLLQVRLAVAGQGVFEASDSAVRLRSASPNRDRLYQATGKRFLPSERTAGR